MSPPSSKRPALLPRAEHVVVPRMDGHRGWRLSISSPPGPPPVQGWPVLYMLDGNTSVDSLRKQAPGLMSELAVVGIGYDLDARSAPLARSWDYTPLPPDAPASGLPDPRAPQRMNGGANAFLAVLENRIKPLVAARLPIDPHRQSLYGHSYGGLFVLHALFRGFGGFQAYIAASPSMWWHAPLMHTQAQAYVKQAGKQAPARVAIMVGGNESLRIQGGPPRLTARDARDLANLLRQASHLQVRFDEMPALNHGQMLAASVAPAAQFALR